MPTRAEYEAPCPAVSYDGNASVSVAAFRLACLNGMMPPLDGVERAGKAGTPRTWTRSAF